MQPRCSPIHHAPGVRHGLGQVHRFIASHAVEKHGHGQRGSLALAPGTIHQPLYKMVNMGAGQRVAVAFDAYDFLSKHGEMNG